MTGAPVIVAKKAEKKPIWIPRLEKPTRTDIQTLSATRSIPEQAIVIAIERGFVWAFDDQINGRCWVFSDRRRKCAIRRRIDNQPYKPKTGQLTKAAACPGADMRHPMCYEEARKFPFFAVAEGGPNGLAIIAQGLASGIDVAPIVMPCTGSRFNKDSLRCLKGKTGRIFVDSDSAGRKAADVWADQLHDAGITVDGFCFDGLKKSDGNPVEDINDIFSPLEQHYSVLESIMDFVAGGNHA